MVYCRACGDIFGGTYSSLYCAACQPQKATQHSGHNNQVTPVNVNNYPYNPNPRQVPQPAATSYNYPYNPNPRQTPQPAATSYNYPDNLNPGQAFQPAATKYNYPDNLNPGQAFQPAATSYNYPDNLNPDQALQPAATSYNYPDNLNPDQALQPAATSYQRGLIGTGDLKSIASFIGTPAFQTTLPRFTNVEVNPVSGNVGFSVNKDSIQCTVCGEWFYDGNALQTHRNGFNIRCSEHGECFASHDTYVHAQSYDHTRCFVLSCGSKYRTETGWSNAEIKQHIRKEHYPQKR